MAPRPLYGDFMQTTIASGDLMRMRSLVPQAEQFLRMAPDVGGFTQDSGDDAGPDPEEIAAALDQLKAEIARLEAAG
jgi:hypothetical protein